MAFLNQQTQILDAVLTKKGRELLSQGSPHFNITKFALADDEVDYGLWNPDHPSGSDYYGEDILNSPILEASTDEAISLRFKLISLPKGTTSIPYINVTPQTVTITMNQQVVITPQTLNGQEGTNNSNLGYTAVLHNSAIASIEVVNSAPGQPGQPNGGGTIPGGFSWTQYTNSQTAVGLTFKVRGKDTTTINADERSTLVTVFGNETGGSETVSLTVNAPSTSSLGGVYNPGS